MRSPMASHIQKSITDNLPQILSAAAVVGVVGTVLLAVRATPEAMADIEGARQNKAQDVFEASGDESWPVDKMFEAQQLTHLEVVKVGWKPYIPAAVAGAATIVCILGSNTIGMRRNAALLGAYTLVDTSFREYKDKVIENVTAQKAQKIDDEVMADKIAKNPPRTETIIMAGGDQLCYESLTGRYFKSDSERVRRAAQDLDAQILQSTMYASANEFFALLGLDSCTIGEELGWTIECRLKVVFSSHKTECDQPALAIGYEKMPVYNYDKL